MGPEGSGATPLSPWRTKEAERNPYVELFPAPCLHMLRDVASVAVLRCVRWHGLQVSGRPAHPCAVSVDASEAAAKAGGARARPAVGHRCGAAGAGCCRVCTGPRPRDQLFGAHAGEQGWHSTCGKSPSVSSTARFPLWSAPNEHRVTKRQLTPPSAAIALVSTGSIKPCRGTCDVAQRATM